MAILLNVAITRPVFIRGAPGIGKSSIVEHFAAELGLPCILLLGSQLAPEDIIGVPQIIDGKSVFCPTPWGNTIFQKVPLSLEQETEPKIMLLLSPCRLLLSTACFM